MPRGPVELLHEIERQRARVIGCDIAVAERDRLCINSSREVVRG